MSWEDENIDKLFQDASKEKTFEFKEEFWNEMEAMLPKKKKRRFPFIWFFSGVIVCTGLAGIILVNGDNDIADKATTENTKENGSDATKLAKIENTVKNSSPEKQITSGKTGSNEKKPVNSNPGSEFREQKDGQTKNLTNSSVTQKYNYTPATSGSGFLNDLTSQPDSHRKNVFNHQSTDKVPTENPIVIQSHYRVVIGNLALLPVPSNHFNSNLLPGSIYNSPIPKWSMYFDLMTSMGQSPIITNSSGSNLSYGMGIGTGINYSTKTWSLNAGLITSFNSFDNLYVRERVKIYGFGGQNFDNEIKYKQLYNLEIPLMAGVKHNNHTFQFGIVPSVLLGSKIAFESKSNEQVYTSSTVYGYRTGLVNFGLKPTIGYLYKLTPTLQIGGNIQIQGISPIVNNIYEGKQNNLPINGQLFIRKSLFLK